MSKIERVLIEQQKKIWFQRVKESKFAIGFILVILFILSWNIYRSTDKVIENEKINGVLLGVHQIQGNLGSTTTMLSIKLNNGDNIMVTAPAYLVVKKQAKVEVIKAMTEQGAVHYYFSAYIELK